MTTRAMLVVLIAAGVSALAQAPPPSGGAGRGRRGFGGPAEPGARFLGAEAGIPGRVVKNAPYSADLVTESIQALPDGNHIRQTSQVRVYRDSEGRTRREQSVNLNGLGSNSNMPQLVFINDPVSGTNYALNARDRVGTKTRRAPGGRMGLGKNPAARGWAGDGDSLDQNLKTEDLGRQTLEGVQVEGRRVAVTIPAGRMGNDQPILIVTETWFSPELQTVVLSRRSDPRSGETVTRMTNISRIEPAHALFEPPTDFKVTESEGRMPRAREAGQGTRQK